MNSLVFLHIPKTAGTSLRAALDPLLEDEEKLYLYGELNAEYLDSLKPEAARARLIYGHISFGIHGALGVPPHYGAMLRRPEDRILSLYHHFGRAPQSPHYKRIQAGMGLSELIRSGAAVEMNNHMTRNFMVWPESGQTFVGERSCLDFAWKTIENHCCYIGLAERYEESVDRLCDILGLERAADRPFLNRYEGDAVSLSDEDRATIAEYNQLDIELYETITKDWEGFSNSLKPLR